MPPQVNQSQPVKPPPPPGYFDSEAQASPAPATAARPAPPPGYFDAEASTEPTSAAVSPYAQPSTQKHPTSVYARRRLPSAAPAPVPHDNQITGIKPPDPNPTAGDMDAFAAQPHGTIGRYLDQAENLTEEGQAEHPIQAQIGKISRGTREYANILGTMSTLLGGPGDAAPPAAQPAIGQISDLPARAPRNAAGHVDVVAAPPSTGGTMRPSSPAAPEIPPEGKLLPPAPEPDQAAAAPEAKSKSTFTVTPLELTDDRRLAMQQEVKRLNARAKELGDRMAKARDWRNAHKHIDEAERASQRAQEITDALQEGRGMDVRAPVKAATHAELRATYNSLDPELKSRVDDLAKEYRSMPADRGPNRGSFEKEYGLKRGEYSGLPLEEKIAKSLTIRQQDASTTAAKYDTSGFLKDTGSLRSTEQAAAASTAPPPHVAKAMEGLDLDYLGEKDGVQHFTDRQTNTSYAIPTLSVTPDWLRAKVTAARELYGPKKPPQDLGKWIPPTAARDEVTGLEIHKEPDLGRVSDETAGDTSFNPAEFERTNTQDHGAQAADNLRYLLDNPGQLLPSSAPPRPTYRTLEAEPLGATSARTPPEVEGSSRAETPSRNNTLVGRMAHEIPGNNPLEPDVPLGQQKPPEQRPPARAEEAGMVDESVHSDDRRFIHVNGARMQQAVGEFGNDNAVAKRVFNLENNQVREALAQSGEDMGTRRVVSAGSKTADPNDFTRQEALDMLLDKGYSPEQIAEMGEKAPRAKPARPLTFKPRPKS